MNTSKTFTENEIATIVVDAALKIHKQLGSGLMESAYQKVMMIELAKRGLSVESEVPIPVIFEGNQIDSGFRADIVVENKVILELKAIQRNNYVHKQQLLSYLKLSNLKLGLVINFGSQLIKDGINRVVNGLEED
ncbi:MAG: GxxExxY protein [Chloroflexi bacterium HGW-Chloroflexi-2]|jgi:GxxExxY protein|nr:MAG: GxxExxY protein [Chloroflexi bacterium HGW-Chloroflexi-2]